MRFTPLLAKNKFLGAMHLCKSKICASGAIFAASLTSKLVDSALLDYTPLLAKNKFLGAVHLCKSKICASGAIFAASLTSKLADSALLDYHPLKTDFIACSENALLISHFLADLCMLLARQIRALMVYYNKEVY